MINRRLCLSCRKSVSTRTLKRLSRGLIDSVRQSSTITEVDLNLDEAFKSDDSDTPWYLRPEETSMVEELNSPLPELPLSSPKSLEQIVKLMHNKLGIENIKIFDKRDDDIEEVGLDMSKSFIIIGTGKSDKHLQKATAELMNFIKHDLGNEKLPRVEGFTKSSSVLKKEKKLRRKLKKNTGYHFEDYGVPINSWIMVDCDQKIGDMSIHFVTDKRREELNLELLWCDPEDKHLYKRERKPVVSDSIFAGLRRYHAVSGSPIYKTVGDFMMGSKRMYSTLNLESISPLKDLELIPDNLEILEKTGDYKSAYHILTNSTDFEESQRGLVLQSFIRHLNGLHSDEALKLVLETDFVKNFEKSQPIIPTKESLRLQFHFFKKLHQLSPSNFRFARLETPFLFQLSISNIDTTIDDVIEYVILILESPLRSKSFRKNRLKIILEVIENNEFILKGWETKLSPYLLCLFSRFHHKDFVKPIVLLDDLDHFGKWNKPLQKNFFYYAEEVDQIYELLKYKKFPFLESNETQLVLLMFLSIYGNAKKFDRFYLILNDVYNTSSLQPDRRPWDFIIGYIYKTGETSDYEHFVSNIYPEISFYNNFSPLFEEYLTKMRDEIKHDELSDSLKL